MVKPTAGRIFLSYRRQDTAYAAGRLADRMADRFGSTRVLRDMAVINSGESYTEAIERAVHSCNVLVVLIGRQWTRAVDGQGRRRLDPDDFVAWEIRAALIGNIPVIPVLVDGASMPPSDQLPAELEPLARLDALPLRNETFVHDVGRLLQAVEPLLGRPRPESESGSQPASELAASDAATGTEPAQHTTGDTVLNLNDKRATAALRLEPVMSFLCHSSGDKERVRDLYLRLLGDGVPCWLDEEDLLPGQNWDLEINKAIRECRFVIVCLSESSIGKRGYVQKELKKALDVADEQPEGSIFLIPVRLECCQIPERLKHIHYVDLFKDKGYEKLLRVLKPGT